ncbi:MAG: ARMT1-like domain-containing protein [Sedimentibacter sp.]|uniref:damage-control phosphatase ARMT1 family protein n=1 Tax=Sedimentibacter sp. TaxID=1960295 RepID=UPI0029813A48|nr:ARMT1-like domain-containing protein [Sedimentibacter sp.]MDW5300164.1 ARMT1-like domain-containing protein [Sedimentibacter sp.]
MDINLECIYCTIKKADFLFSQHETDEDKKLKFMKEVFEIISKSDKNDTAPYIAAKIMRILNSKLNLSDIYYEIKKQYNNLLCSMEEEISTNIYMSEDNILTAMKYAMIGNFIDFGAMDKVDINELKKIIKSAEKQEINIKEYESFKEDLYNSKHIVYIVDNAGEIVFDKIFIKVLKENYPRLVIDVIVRGKPIYNDATITDANEIGLCSIVNVIENGTDIPGTQLDKINIKSKNVIDNADLIISKGQGNFETLFGCEKNIYYLFLCKCDLFTKRFNLEKFKGIFVNERNVKDIIKKN